MDAKSQSLGLPVNKISKVTGMASSFLTTRQTERSAWEAFLGRLAFACQIGPDLNLQKKLLGPILHQFHSGESLLPLPPETLEALAWWASPENLSKWFPFGQWAPSCLVWPDACKTGWEVTIRRVLGQRGHGTPTRVLFT